MAVDWLTYYVVIVQVLILFTTEADGQECKTATEFYCRQNKFCIAASQVCNNINECWDNSDEQDCQYPPVDYTKALILTLTDRESGYSRIVQLYGDPDDYAWKFANSSFDDSLPINRDSLWFSGYDSLHALTVGYRRQIVFFSDNYHGSIYQALFVYNNYSAGSWFEALPPSKQVYGIAFDWVSTNLYWTDAEEKLILVYFFATHNGYVWKTIVSNLSAPQDIVVHPLLCYLFWSDGAGADAKIERSDLSGNSRVVLVNSTQGLVAPTTLVVDFTSQRLYWLDAAASTLGAVNFDGSNMTAWYRSEIANFSTMAIYQNYLFFGDRHRSKIYIYDKSSILRISERLVVTHQWPISDMAMFAIETQPSATSPCSDNSGGCSQLCFTTSATTRICDCLKGFVLGADGVTCYTNPFQDNNFLLVADYNGNNIYQLKPDTGPVRALLQQSAKIRPLAVTFDPDSKTVYSISYEPSATSVTRYKYRIRKKSLDGKTDVEIYSISTANANLYGLTLDTENQVLYYSDRVSGQIMEIQTDGSQRREVFVNMTWEVDSIVVDSRSGRLYWTNYSTTPTIHSSFVNGTDITVLVNGTINGRFTAIHIDFNNQIMYFVYTNEKGSTVEMMSLNGTASGVLVENYPGYFTTLTLYSRDALLIGVANERHILKLNLTTGETSDLSPGMFAKVTGLKFFSSDVTDPLTTERVTTSSSTSTMSPGSPTTVFICVFRITNLEFTPSLGDPTSSEYKNLSAVLIPLLSKVFRDEFGTIFVSIVNVYFTSGSVVVSSDIGLSSSPTDDMVNRTTTQVGNQLTANGFNVTAINVTVATGRITTTYSTTTSAISTSGTTLPPESHRALIIGVVVGVGGFVIILLIVIVVCVIVFNVRSEKVAISQVPPSKTHSEHTYSEIRPQSIVGSSTLDEHSSYSDAKSRSIISSSLVDEHKSSEDGKSLPTSDDASVSAAAAASDLEINTAYGDRYMLDNPAFNDPAVAVAAAADAADGAHTHL